MAETTNYKHSRECDYCGAKFETNIEHKVFCSPVCKKTFENVIGEVMKAMRPVLIKALKKMRDDRVD